MDSNFFLQTNKRHSLEEIDADHLSDDELSSIFHTYISNMNEAICVVQSSFDLMLHAELQRRAENIFRKNHMRAYANALRGDYEEDSDRINKEAQKATDEEISSGEAYKDSEIIKSVKNSLSALEQDEAVASSNLSTLRQSIVIVWSATESLIRDVVRALLNNNKALAVGFFESPLTNPYWNKKQISYEQLKYYDFDISNRMGDVALDLNACNNTRAMIAAYAFLLGKHSCTHKIIKSERFYRLFKLRNVIAHKNGVVDHQYKSDTGSEEAIGERVRVKPETFTQCFETSREVAIALLGDLSN